MDHARQLERDRFDPYYEHMILTQTGSDAVIGVYRLLRGCQAAMAGGFLTWLIARYIAPELPGDLIGMSACLVIMVAVSLATQKIDPPKPARDIDGNVVEFKDRLGTLGLRP